MEILREFRQKANISQRAMAEILKNNREPDCDGRTC